MQLISYIIIITLTISVHSAHHISSSTLPLTPSNNSPLRIKLSRLPRRLKSPIRQQPQPLRRTLPGRNPRNIMAPSFHKRHRGIIIRRLKARIGGYQLIVQSGLREGLRGSHSTVEHVPQVLDCGGDDARAAGRADGEVEGPVGEVLDYCC